MLKYASCMIIEKAVNYGSLYLQCFETTCPWLNEHLSVIKSEFSTLSMLLSNKTMQIMQNPALCFGPFTYKIIRRVIISFQSEWLSLKQANKNFLRSKYSAFPISFGTCTESSVVLSSQTSWSRKGFSAVLKGISRDRAPIGLTKFEIFEIFLVYLLTLPPAHMKPSGLPQASLPPPVVVSLSFSPQPIFSAHCTLENKAPFYQQR